MKEFLKKALTSTVWVETRRRTRKVELPPSDRLLAATILLVSTMACLVVLELAHLIILKTWNSEIFGVISGLIGTVSGIVLARKG